MADDGPWEIVQRINRAWRRGDADGMGELFHADAVIVHPGFEGRTVGREACVESYREFTAQATVRRLAELDPQIDVVGDTAVVTYGFEIDYDMGRETRAEKGRDVFVLTRGKGSWRVVWRTLVMDE